MIPNANKFQPLDQMNLRVGDIIETDAGGTWEVLRVIEATEDDESSEKRYVVVPLTDGIVRENDQMQKISAESDMLVRKLG